MSLALLAEQNLVILEEIKSLKKNIKGSFWEFGETVVDTIATCYEEKNKNVAKKDTKDMGTQTDETPKAEKAEMKETKERAKESHAVRDKKKKDGSHMAVAWIGDMEKSLDKEKFEKETNSKVKFFNAYGITEDTADYPHKNFKTMVPEVVNDEDVDTLVLQGGSTEITNIKVNESMMNIKKDVEEYKKQWFSQAEDDSKELFDIAEDALKMKPALNIIIIKRLPRFDRRSQDIIGIKAKISDFANKVLDQEWLKRGSPPNIHIVDLKLIQESKYLKSLIFGNLESNQIDGIQLRGMGARRHFTYRSVQAFKQALAYPMRPAKSARKPARQVRDNYHATCPQTMYAKERYNNLKTGDQLFSRNRKGKFYSNTARSPPYPGYRTYSDAVKEGPTRNTVRGENMFNHLNF